VHVDVGADERCRDICLQIRESQDEVGLKIQDLRDVGGGERGYPWLLAPCPWRANYIARDTHDAGIFTEEIQGFDCFLGKANDPLRREHPSTLSTLNPKRIALYPAVIVSLRCGRITVGPAVIVATYAATKADTVMVF